MRKFVVSILIRGRFLSRIEVIELSTYSRPWGRLPLLRRPPNYIVKLPVIEEPNVNPAMKIPRGRNCEWQERKRRGERGSLSTSNHLEYWLKLQGISPGAHITFLGPHIDPESGPPHFLLDIRLLVTQLLGWVMGGSPGEANLVQQIVLTMGQRNVKVHIGRDQYEKSLHRANMYRSDHKKSLLSGVRTPILSWSCGKSTLGEHDVVRAWHTRIYSRPNFGSTTFRDVR